MPLIYELPPIRYVPTNPILWPESGTSWPELFCWLNIGRNRTFILRPKPGTIPESLDFWSKPENIPGCFGFPGKNPEPTQMFWPKIDIF